MAKGKRNANQSMSFSDRPQSERNSVVAKFKWDSLRVLVATPLLGRGMDIDNVEHVCAKKSREKEHNRYVGSLVA